MRASSFLALVMPVERTMIRPFRLPLLLVLAVLVCRSPLSGEEPPNKAGRNPEQNITTNNNIPNPYRESFPRSATPVRFTQAEGPHTRPGLNWEPALKQSLAFTGLLHSFRVCCQADVRAELFDRPWLKDYFRSVGNIGGWADGDPFYVSYIGHPFQGAVTGFIEIQNNSNAMKQEWGSDGYWNCRLQAMAFSAVFGAQFKIGPVSEAMIGHVGLPNRYRTRPNLVSPKNGGMSYNEFVTEPVGGAAWMIVEDILDRYVVRRIEAKTQNRLLIDVARSLLNPSRSFANVFRLKKLWFRDTRGAVKPTP
jgi:hypothetical protein